MLRQILGEQLEPAPDRYAEMRREVSFLDAFAQGSQRPQPHLIDRRPRRQLAAIDALGPQVASDQGRLDEPFATLCRRKGRPIMPPFLAVTRRPAHQLEQLPGKEDGRNARLLVAPGEVVDAVDQSRRTHRKQRLLLARLHHEVPRPGNDDIQPGGHEQGVVAVERLQKRNKRALVRDRAGKDLGGRHKQSDFVSGGRQAVAPVERPRYDGHVDNAMYAVEAPSNGAFEGASYHSPSLRMNFWAASPVEPCRLRRRSHRSAMPWTSDGAASPRTLRLSFFLANCGSAP